MLDSSTLQAKPLKEYDMESVESYLARGGKITLVALGATGLSPLTGLTASENKRVIESAKKGSALSSRKKGKQMFEGINQDELNDEYQQN